MKSKDGKIPAPGAARKKGGIIEALVICAPLVAAMSAHALNQFIDRVFLARYSDLAIQCSLPGSVLSWLFTCLLMTVAAYSGTFIAQFAGARAYRDCARALGQGVWLTLAAVPLFLLCIPLGHFIFNLFGHAPEVLAGEKTYYDIMIIGGILITAEAVLVGFFTGLGKTLLAGAAFIAGNAANILLDYLMIFGKWGFPEMGIAGAGWATVIATALPCAILAAAALRHRLLRGRRALAAMRFDRRMTLRIVRFGFPSGFHCFVDVLTFTVFVLLVGRLDAMSFAVSNIVFTVNHLSLAPLMGLQQGAAVLSGRYQGAGDSAAAYRSGWSCAVLGWIYFAAFACLMLVFSDAIMDLFHASNSAFDPDSFRALGRTLMIILASWGLFDAADLAFGGSLKGAGDTRYVMAVMVVTGVFFWMPAVFAVLYFHPTVVAMWLTMPFYYGLVAALIAARWIGGRWRKMELVKDLMH